MSKNRTGNKVLVEYVVKQRENLKWWQLKEAKLSTVCMETVSGHCDQNYDSANKQSELNF